MWKSLIAAPLFLASFCGAIPTFAESMPGATSEERQPRLSVTWENRLVSVDAVEMDLGATVKVLSEKTGVEISLFEGVAGKVTLHEERAPLEKVVDDLLAAVGQRNYLMVFDGDGLTKLSIVPKGSGGGLSDDAKRVKVKGRLREETTFRESGHHYIDLKTGKDVTGNLRTGREIEYYPGEIIVSMGRSSGLAVKEDARVAAFVDRLEKKHGLVLMKRTALFTFQVLKFRILNGRDVIDVMYEIAETGGTGPCVLSPNGLGTKSTEIPEEDLNVYRDLTNADLRDCEARGLKRYAQCMMDKNPFLKMDYLKEGATQPTKYFEGLFYWGPHEPLLISRAVGLAADEGALFLGGGDTYLYFPDLRGASDHAAMMKKLGKRPMTWRDQFGTACRPNDTLYVQQWNLAKVRAGNAWELENGSRGVRVGVLDKDFLANHDDFGTRLAENDSAHFTTPGFASRGKGSLEDGVSDSPGHGSRVAGIAGAITSNDKGIAGVAGGGCDAAQGITLVGLQMANDFRTAKHAAWYAGGLVFADSVEYAANEPTNEWNLASIPPWGVVNEGAGNHAWADSPSGNYSDSGESALQSHPQDLQGTEGLALSLSFRAKWALQSGDLVHVERSDDGGINWFALGSPLSGLTQEWTTLNYGITFGPFDIRPADFRIRFRLAGNGDGQTDDGISIDDVEIQIMDTSSQPPRHKKIVDVLNVSIDLFGDPAFVFHALAAAYSKGVFIVLAAGQGNQGLSFDSIGGARQDEPTPSGIDEKLLVVSATDRDDHHWLPANYGGFIDVSAPGVDILSSTGGGVNAYTRITIPKSPAVEIDGTSYAAPHVAALAALLLSKDRTLTPAEVTARIKNTADPISDPGMGAGRINMYSVLRGSRDTQPPSKPADWGLLNESSDIKVTWKPSTDNDAIGEYVVLRRGAAGVSCAWPVIVAGTQYCTLARVFPDGTNDKVGLTSGYAGGVYSFVDATAVTGEYYYYRLTALDKTGNPSLPTDEMDTVPPGKPGNLVALGGNGEATTTWVEPTHDEDGTELNGLAGYRVYYSSELTILRDSWVPAATPSKELTGLTNKTTYFICVTAVDTNGNESACSDTVTVRPLDAIWVHYPEKISDALAAAGPGATVMVGPGDYSETELHVGGDSGTIQYSPQNVSLRSERGPGQTRILGPNSLTVADGCSVIGFTIADQDGTGIDCMYASDVLIANNIFISNLKSIYTGGHLEGAADRSVRIYNNVFVGSVSYAQGIYEYFDYGIVDVENNIFRGTAANVTGISAYYGSSVVVRYNDFYGNKTDIAVQGNVPLVSHKYTWSPGFVDFRSSDPLASDFHLMQQPAAGLGVDEGARRLQYKNVNWDSDCDGSPTDLGAFGGPFAYVDNDLPGDSGHGIPDCLEPLAVAGAMVVLKNSVSQPITLQARNPAGEVSFDVVTPPRGTLTGTAPTLAYTVIPDSLEPDALSFTVTNEVGESAPAPMSIRVKETNHIPEVGDTTLVLEDNQVGEVTLQGTDEDGDALTFVIEADPSWVICQYAPTCYITIRGSGEPRSFSYHVNDGATDSNSATVSVLKKKSFAFSEPKVGNTLLTNAGAVTLAWTDSPSSGALSSLYSGGELPENLIAADIPESDPTNAFTWDISTLPDGDYPISARMVDEWTVRWVDGGLVRIDRTPPQVWADLEDGLYATAQQVHFAVSEAAVIRCTTDGTDPTTASADCRVSFNITDTTTLKFLAVDLAGNMGPIVTRRYTIDRPPFYISVPDVVAENQPAGTLIGTLSTTDPDPGDIFTYELDSGILDNDFFRVSGGTLQSAVSFDYEAKRTYSILVRSTDQDGLSVQKTLTIRVMDVQEPPTDIG